MLSLQANTPPPKIQRNDPTEDTQRGWRAELQYDPWSLGKSLAECSVYCLQFATISYRLLSQPVRCT